MRFLCFRMGFPQNVTLKSSFSSHTRPQFNKRCYQTTTNYLFQYNMQSVVRDIVIDFWKSIIYYAFNSRSINDVNYNWYRGGKTIGHRMNRMDLQIPFEDLSMINWRLNKLYRPIRISKILCWKILKNTLIFDIGCQSLPLKIFFVMYSRGICD
jgi:hypothetical protein